MVSLTPELEHIPTAHFAPEALELGYTWNFIQGFCSTFKNVLNLSYSG